MPKLMEAPRNYNVFLSNMIVGGVGLYEPERKNALALGHRTKMHTAVKLLGGKQVRLDITGSMIYRLPNNELLRIGDAGTVCTNQGDAFLISFERAEQLTRVFVEAVNALPKAA